MQPPNDLVRACLRWTVPAPTDMTDDPRQCVTNEADAIRGMPDLTKSDQRQVTRACVADSANGNRLIESREPAAVGGGERGQISVGYLALPVQPRVVNKLVGKQEF